MITIAAAKYGASVTCDQNVIKNSLKAVVTQKYQC